MIVMGEKYRQLIERLPLRRIKSEKDLDEALKIAEELYLKIEQLDQDQLDYLDVLSDLIAKYEDTHHKVDTSDVTQADMLRHLIEQAGMNQSDLARLLDVSRGRASELVNGHRQLTMMQIAIAAKHFKIKPELLLAPLVPKLEPDAT